MKTRNFVWRTDVLKSENNAKSKFRQNITTVAGKQGQKEGKNNETRWPRS
jgi:hypothetical protein